MNAGWHIIRASKIAFVQGRMCYQGLIDPKGEEGM